MTLLDDIIDASTDSSVSVADLLRKVQIVAHRLGATDLVAWAKQELAGYDDDATVPSYRVLHTNVEGVFSGPMQSFRPLMLTVKPAGLEDWWEMHLRQPLVELQALADIDGDNDPSREWPAHVVERFRRSGMFRLEFHELYTARNIITRQSLKGVLDVIRSKALEFALELQSADPEVGSVGGPTLASEPELANVVYNVTNNIYGDGVNIATGSNIKQKSRVTKGDADALRHEARALGLPEEAVEEFVQVVDEENALDKPKVRAFLERVRTGAITLAGSVSSDVVAGSLVELGKGFLGL